MISKDKSNDTPSIADATRDLIATKPFLRELMDMDAVNYRGLARHFRPMVEEKTGKESINLESIVMAIRRYEEDTTIGNNIIGTIEDVLAQSELTLKGDIVYYTFPRKPEYHQAAIESYQEIDRKSGDRIYILQSDAEIEVVLDRKNAAIIEAATDRGDAKNIETDLAMVIMDSPEEILHADGILSYLTEKIFSNGIGLVDMFTTYTETVFIVREDESTELYSVLRDLIARAGEQA